ncbi:MAG: hypothetical protein PVI43_00560 [Candidatus Bathyarchaeota archaeon]|jgi:hypothetical protein
MTDKKTPDTTTSPGLTSIVNRLNVEDKDLVASTETMKRQLPIMNEAYITIAKMKKNYYDALIAEGFSREEALELCKQMEL